MRKHLFRGFHPDERGTTEITLNGKKVKGYWVEGNLFVSDDKTEYQMLMGSKTICIAYDVLPETVCEYTGLSNRNAKRIFEGDIHENNGNKYVVKYGAHYDCDRECNYFGWYFQDIKNEEWCECFDGNESQYVNIIGNIFENPELLK